MIEAKFVIERLTEHGIQLLEFDFEELANQIEEYNILLEEAASLGIEWDANNYDVVALQQKIEEGRQEERRIVADQRRDYYHSIKL